VTRKRRLSRAAFLRCEYQNVHESTPHDVLGAKGYCAARLLRRTRLSHSTSLRRVKRVARNCIELRDNSLRIVFNPAAPDARACALGRSGTELTIAAGMLNVRDAQSQPGETRMLFYNSIGPNPRVVRMFMAEKGLKIPSTEIDLMKGDNRKEPYLAKNPHGQMPALELDDGSCVNEITAICEYLEDTHPSPALIGATAKEKAETRMWTRRIDLNICEPLANGFRYSEGLPLFKDRMVTLPEAADGLKKIARDRLQWLDGRMAGREYVSGKRFTLADILLYAFLDFGGTVGQKLDPANTNLASWFVRIKARPSTAA
jgi:glutathione S-transferase